MSFDSIIIRPPLKACGGMLCAECAVIRAPVGDIEIKGVSDGIGYFRIPFFSLYAEKLLCIQCGYSRHIIQRNGFYFRNPPGGLRQPSRLVPIPHVVKARETGA